MNIIFPILAILAVAWCFYEHGRKAIKEHKKRTESIIKNTRR